MDKSMTSMNEFVTKTTVINEIRRWSGYIDDDMIERIVIGIKNIPSVPVTPIFEVCSECGTALLTRTDYGNGYRILFCPKCGYSNY
jgi:hypothetical protein